MRFVCLNCRDVTICEQCMSKGVMGNEVVDLEGAGSYIKRKEHRSNHVFLRVMDYQTAKISY